MNINEIAAMAGVSRATVSRYLNKGYVSGEKKERIRKVIEETGFQPSAQAKMLRTKKTGSIGVVLPRINSDSISRMVHGISGILREKGYQLLLAVTQDDTKEEIRCLKQLGQNYVDGIILIGTIFTKEHYKVMREMKIPLVVLAQCVKEYSCVYYDDYGAAKELTKRALEHGRNPAFIGGLLEEETVGQERLYGFLDANFEVQRTIREEYCIHDTLSIEKGYENAKSLFDMDSEIDTLICATDTIAVGAMRFLKEYGKKIPEDVQVAGMGDNDISKICNPMLTTVHFYYKTSGEEAAKMLIKMIEDSLPVLKEMKIGYQIVERETLRKDG